MRTLTDNQLLDIQEKVCSFGLSIEYRLTDAEYQWFNFVFGRYSIADYLNETMQPNHTVTLNSELSEHLDADCRGTGKAVCLSDDTDLQAIFFYCYTETA